jgi:hypothetical protein
MGLLFPYNVIAVPHAVISLGGRWSRPRPRIIVSLVGPSKTLPTRGLLDTGSDDTVFPEHLAASIGLDLTNAPIGQGSAANLTNVPLRYAQVHLRITDGHEQREWPAWVGFTPVKLHLPLLGFAGFLQFFTATFHGDREDVELTVNSLLYPGT